MLRTLIILVTATSLWSQNLVMTDPVQNSYLSGNYEVSLELQGPDPAEVAETLLWVNGKEVYRGAGFRSSFHHDFGQSIRALRLEAEVRFKDGRRLKSEPIQTKALKVDFQEESRRILITATVKSRRDVPLTDIPSQSFRVLENGRPLAIQNFYTERLPLDLALILDTSSSLRDDINFVRYAGQAFIKNLDLADKVALLEIKTRPVRHTPFSTDRKPVQRQIAQIEPMGETALFDTLIVGLKTFENRLKGRKAVILFTDGRDSVHDDPEILANLMRTAITTAQNLEVAIYTVGMGNKINEPVLNRISEETGGSYFHAASGSRLGAAFDRIIDELSHQYVLAVEPQAEAKGFHRLEVKVRRRGARVHARKGYTLEY